ncbi:MULTISPECIES: hypothetical protein [Pseudothermotoga]|jgi:hypothetical protein|uniref:hypothetical protein n=1 Tax=Pseudothermotoga TaxID=1643951 RepID=UPI000423A479|nr:MULTISPECIES: hypothetical protein [Pseudothermotoga]
MQFLIGTNYWSKSGAFMMWEDEYYNPEIIKKAAYNERSWHELVQKFSVFANIFSRAKLY